MTIMAAIYDYETGNIICDGLQGRRVCDEAIQAARSIAAERGEAVHLEDDDGDWLVTPSGRTRLAIAPVCEDDPELDEPR